MITILCGDENLLEDSPYGEVEERFPSSQLRKFIFGVVRCGNFGKPHVFNFILEAALKESLF